jgi:hypothetical protein
MAGYGPAPKAKSHRGKDNQGLQRVHVADDGEVRGVELPEDVDWHPRTVAWWETWRRSPQAQVMTPTDWDFLLDTALMHTAMWAKKQWALAAEVRLRVAKFGATPEDRLRLRLQIDLPEASAGKPEPGTVTSIQSRRSRLLSD